MARVALRPHDGQQRSLRLPREATRSSKRSSARRRPEESVAAGYTTTPTRRSTPSRARLGRSTRSWSESRGGLDGPERVRQVAAGTPMGHRSSGPHSRTSRHRSARCLRECVRREVPDRQDHRLRHHVGGTLGSAIESHPAKTGPGDQHRPEVALPRPPELVRGCGSCPGAIQGEARVRVRALETGRCTPWSGLTSTL